MERTEIKSLYFEHALIERLQEPNRFTFCTEFAGTLNYSTKQQKVDVTSKALTQVRNTSTIYQIFKELLCEIALSCKRSKPSQRDRLAIKDLPLLLWQIVKQPGFKRKIS